MLSDKRHKREEDGLNPYRAFANKLRGESKNQPVRGRIFSILPSVDEVNLIFCEKKKIYLSKISNYFSKTVKNLHNFILRNGK